MASGTCAQCGGSVAIDAERCPHCGTRDFAAVGRSDTVIALLAVVLVASIAVVAYRALFLEPARAPLEPRLVSMFEQCVEKFREHDPSAKVEPRLNFSDTGLYMSWPTGAGGLVIRGREVSGSCTVIQPGGEVQATVSGADI